MGQRSGAAGSSSTQIVRRQQQNWRKADIGDDGVWHAGGRAGGGAKWTLSCSDGALHPTSFFTGWSTQAKHCNLQCCSLHCAGMMTVASPSVSLHMLAMV
ncbi:hypothetical protein GOP47_0000058 [Adiantum capillus-veneris]|uniref:Uncharacterized protein n=1 Tax=Adiantum capillus-veneris TaxID=13818 RepID=A0A9D4ZQ76_ADICA|nr:hypothetical protein GOP47_0000058 [Adiantum capillus-veneris]